MIESQPHRRAAGDLTNSTLPEALYPLLETARAICPGARVTVMSVSDHDFEVTGSSVMESRAYGSRFDSDSMFTLRELLDVGPLIIGSDDERIPADVRDLLKSFDFVLGFLSMLHATEDITECVVIDVPGAAIELSARDEALLGAAVRQARVALEAQDLREQMSSRQRTLEALARLGIVFTSLMGLRDTAEQVVDYASLLLGLPAFVLLYRPLGEARFTVFASEGLSDEVNDYSMNPIDVAAFEVPSRGGYIGHRLTDGDEPLQAYLKRQGFTDLLAAPLVVGEGRLCGVLLALGHGPFDLRQDQEEAFHLLALQATNAVWNAERYESEVSARAELKRELGTTSLLLEATDLLTRTLDTNRVLEELVELISRATELKRVVVSLIDPAHDEMVVRAATGAAPLTVGARMPVATLSPQVRTAILEKRACIVDYDAGPISQHGTQRGASSLPRLALTVPLILRDEVVGTIEVDDPGVRHALSKREIDVIEGIASQAAAAIDNARLFEQQRDVAELLQQSLLALPRRIDGVEFGYVYHSASEAGHVGGDFYDIFQMDCDRIGVVVGDIAGKGLKAAVLTSLLKDTLRAHTAESHKTPEEILRLTNAIVYQSTAPEEFATVFFGILDRSTGRFVYANAGHTTGAVIRINGTVSELPATGPIVGAFTELEFGQKQLVLAPGDTLFLYTDGLIEARRDSEEFGEERLFGLLESSGSHDPHDVVHMVFDASTEFTGGVLRDDLALFAVQRR